MSIPYSNDLRKKALKMIDEGMQQREVSRLLSINRSTLFRWKKRRQLEGDCNFKGYNNNQAKCKITNLVKFEDFIKNNNLTLEEYSLKLGNVKREAVRMAIKKIGYSFKKNSGYIKNEMIKLEKSIIKK